MKKKLLSLTLALALSLSLAVPAFAAEEDKADTAAPTESSSEEKQDETPAEGEEKKDETPAEGEEEKDEAPAEGEEEKDETPAEGEEKKDETPAEGEEKKDEAPAEGEEKKDEPPAAPKFTDVAATSPFAKAIDWAVAEGITTGKTETTFGPSDTCTVSHILTFLWRANGKPGAAEGVKDRDAAAKWAVEQELIAEDEDVNAPCTRMMAVSYLWKVAGKAEAETEVSFTDVDKEAGYLPAIAWAVEKEITSGTGDGTTFEPEKTCTRGQIVTFLHRAAYAPAPQEAAE